MSGVGVIALAGIVVNNNIVLIDTYNEFRRAGLPAAEAVLRTGAQRLRPVLLTTITTILGLMPMVCEGQHQFLYAGHLVRRTVDGLVGTARIGGRGRAGVRDPSYAGLDPVHASSRRSDIEPTARSKRAKIEKTGPLPRRFGSVAGGIGLAPLRLPSGSAAIMVLCVAILSHGVFVLI